MWSATLLFLYGALLRFGASSGGFEPPFGCGLRLNDSNRTAALSTINALRSNVALGQFFTLPSSSNLSNLAWDCNLEFLAQVLVEGCPGRVDAAGTLAFNYVRFPSNGSIISRNFPLTRALLEWSQLLTMWPSNNSFDESLLLRALANMINGNATAVGCSVDFCPGNNSATLCVFSAPVLETGDQVYMTGQPCLNGQPCLGPGGPGVCDNGLCVVSINQTTTTTTSVPTTRTTTPATTTTRRRSTDCPSRAFSSAFRETALGMHNNFRSSVARGLERNGEYPNENAPPASRMDLMEYDCQAEQLALSHARTCDRRESSPAARPGYSENIHVLGTTATDILGAIQNAIATFMFELRGNGIPSNMILTLQVLQRTRRTVTRVSKVLWASNRFVGCAAVLCSGFYFTSCMYRNPVNVLGQSIYPIGAVCSACPTGPNNCNPAIGLCSY